MSVADASGSWRFRGQAIQRSPRSAEILLGRLGRLLGQKPEKELLYVVPDANWITDWIGHYVTAGVEARHGLPGRLMTPSAVRGQFGKIVHFTSLWEFATAADTPLVCDNDAVATVFHGSLDAENPLLRQGIERLVENAHKLKRLLTASTMMMERFSAWGLPDGLCSCIPLGIDLDVFRPVSAEKRQHLRLRYGIPEEAICIGSFQKDGDGWGEGNSPKMIKGPDIFLDVLAKLVKHAPLFVLLSAPARGYVKRGLERLNIPYRHEIVGDYQSVAEMYGCLDLYLMASREEGGPSSVLESLACGVHFVGSITGLAPDVITHDLNGLLVEAGNADALARQVARLIDAPELRARLAAEGLKTIQPYDWPLIADRYYNEIYAPLIQSR